MVKKYGKGKPAPTTTPAHDPAHEQDSALYRMREYVLELESALRELRQGLVSPAPASPCVASNPAHAAQAWQQMEQDILQAAVARARQAASPEQGMAQDMMQGNGQHIIHATLDWVRQHGLPPDQPTPAPTSARDDASS